ncbi:MAG: hypothetical protein JXK07_06255 [Spirochaetes bacterium]|nr:hypothetical protein [Spirochaetota bacterium]
MNQEPGQSRLAMIAQKKLAVIGNAEKSNAKVNVTTETNEPEKPIIEVQKTEYEGQKGVETIPESNNTAANSGNVTTENEIKNEEVKQKKDRFKIVSEDLLNPKMQEFVKTIIQQVRESSDPKILKRHPAYKGERVKRSYVFKLEHDNWLNQIYNVHRIEKTKVLEDALELYLNEKYLDCKP